jgi:amino acid transporter
MDVFRFKSWLFGQPLEETQEAQELSVARALPVLFADMLSSAAYASSELLIPVAAAVGAGGMQHVAPAAFAVVGVLWLMGLAYSYSVDAHPQKGGAYQIVKSGKLPSPIALLVGAALLLEQILAVAVSSSFAIETCISAFPGLAPYQTMGAISFVAMLMLVHLRGSKPSHLFLVFPTYLFLFLGFTLTGAALKAVISGNVVLGPVTHDFSLVGAWILLKAFSAGCCALTGLESISQGTRFFTPPGTQRAKRTLWWAVTLLTLLFLGLTWAAVRLQLNPRAEETLISQIARQVLGDGPLYYFAQLAIVAILAVAANSSFVQFPKLAAELADDRYLPRQMASIGDRLVHSNGIFGLFVFSSILIFLLKADAHHLLPLYAVGVFISFAATQWSMWKHQHKEQKEGWRWRASVALVAMSVSLLVLGIIISTRFLSGAWAPLFMLPLMIFIFRGIHRHYLVVGSELRLGNDTPIEKFKAGHHTVIVPVSGMHRGTLVALRYAQSLSEDVRAVYVEVDARAAERMKEEWQKWAHEIPFVVLKSPTRSVLKPFLDYIDDVESLSPREMITIVVPEFVSRKWRYQILHNQTALMLRAAVAMKPNRVVTSVKYHLKNT